MKNLKDIILEKLKVTKNELLELDIYDTDTVIEFLTGDDIGRRQIAIDTIREEVINCGCQRMSRYSPTVVMFRPGDRYMMSP